MNNLAVNFEVFRVFLSQVSGRHGTEGVITEYLTQQKVSKQKKTIIYLPIIIIINNATITNSNPIWHNY